MAITSATFAVFGLLVLLVYYALPRRAQNAWLLLGSFVFISTWAWQFALELLGVTLVNFFLAHRVSAGGRARASVVWFGVAFNVLALLWFKNLAFFAPQLLAMAARLGVPVQPGGLEFLLPLGLSYYTLQAISYLVDVYRGLLPATRNFVDFALYMAYFPKLVAGPIERARSFLPKLAAERVVDNAMLARGVTLIVVGLVRKIVLADSLTALIPPLAFFVPKQYAWPQLLFNLIAYAFALYNDFAGYTSIVRGVSALFGIELSPNFVQPYFSRNFTEFWNRWHISLSYWLRDYIFFPLSRLTLRRNSDRKALINVALPPLVTIVVSGLWHASWLHRTLLLWGLMHGLYLVGERVVTLGRPVVPPDKWPGRLQIFGTLVVFALVALAWVPFREGSHMRIVLEYWVGLISLSAWRAPDWRILVFVLPSLWLDWVQARHQDEVVFVRWPLLVRSSLLALAVVAIAISRPVTGGTSFVYRGF